MREAFLWGQVAGPILGGCLVWGRSGPSMVFSRAVLSACLVSLLVPAAWRGPSHVALRLVQGLCTVSRRVDLINVISLDASQRELREISRETRINYCDNVFCRAQPCLLLTCWLWRGLRVTTEAGTSVVTQVGLWLCGRITRRFFKWDVKCGWEYNKSSPISIQYCFVRKTYLGRYYDFFRIFFKAFHRTLYIYMIHVNRLILIPVLFKLLA